MGSFGNDGSRRGVGTLDRTYDASDIGGSTRLDDARCVLCARGRPVGDALEVLRGCWGVAVRACVGGREVSLVWTVSTG